MDAVRPVTLPRRDDQTGVMLRWSHSFDRRGEAGQGHLALGMARPSLIGRSNRRRGVIPSNPLAVPRLLPPVKGWRGT